jgi:signal transduction histidine kinase/CheY-like chemotaxis protein
VNTASGNKARVLYVDDEPAFTELAVAFLMGIDEGLHIEPVTSAAAALERLEMNGFDCIVSDYRMPEMDGIELLRTVRESDPDIPFVLFTGRGSEEVASEAIAAGVTDYLTKGPSQEYFNRLAERVRDVSARRARQEYLRMQTTRLELLAEHVPVVLFTLDPDGVIIDATGKGLAALETDDITGQPVFDYFAAEDTAAAAVARALDGERVEVVGRAGDAIYRTWYHPITDDDERVTKVVGVAFDVTVERRRTERLQALTEATRELLTVTDPDEVARLVVDIADRLLPDRLVVFWRDDPKRGVLVPEALSGATLEFAEATTGAPPHEIGSGSAEMETFRAGEATIIEDYTALENPSHPAAPLGTTLLAPVGFHGLLGVAAETVTPIDDFDRLLVDLLTRKAAVVLDRADDEATLAAYQRELERSNESLQEFAYIASHDLQEPLRMVSSYLQLLAEEYEGQLGAEADQYIHFAVDGARRMKSMIEALLDYSRVDTLGKEPQSVETERVVDETLSVLEVLIEEHDAVVDVGALPTVEADPNQLGQLFQNLVSNAIQHGGRTVEVRGEATEEGWHFVVSDDGPGIPEHQDERIFELFARGDQGGGADGTGIGLAICERIVQRHGGHIWVESTDEGAAFHFTLARPGTAQAEVAT